jgi:transposase InsO family protein
MTVPSLGNFVYYVIFIDDYSRKTWIYFLKVKDEVFSKFQEFKALVENLSGSKIKILRSDNGGEYTSNEFKYFCREAGIKRELTTPYNPQQNGVAERKNRSIVEATKAMIHDKELTHAPMGRSIQYKSCMSRIEVLIRYWGTRHQKKYSPERSQKSAT